MPFNMTYNAMADPDFLERGKRVHIMDVILQVYIPVHMYNGVGFRFADFLSFFLNIP